ncbi:hypothetical protein ASC94_12495 [Massilia sp. Root418]|uniref:DUF6984 family protein n=1 Tax=Massilia sp. Root418 TaxID=1736532 RepID=UPI0006FB03BC|nr:hypothetical protein [Massilia sp. Root418]KQW93450.1 hypothetical protein ASC94_12495 [Massilia sp. Root418]
MLDESPQSGRPLRPNELAVLAALPGAPWEAEPRLRASRVEDMADGGMGSVRFLSQASAYRRFGRRAAEALYVDADGVTVVISLNLDEKGDLFELDFWKSDFSPLRSYPKPAQLLPYSSCER